MTPEESGDKSNCEATDCEHDPQFTPIVSLPEVHVPTLEEDEVEILKLRAKLYRFDQSGTVPEWKERGTGEIKMLKNENNNTVRVVMRRDKTLKVCANHFITPFVKLKPKPGQDKVFIYTTPADFTYETVQSECFAIKFGTVDYAHQFMKTFLDSQKYVTAECKLYNGQLEEEDEDDEDASDYEDNSDGEQVEKHLTDKQQLADKSNDNDVAQIQSKLQVLDVRTDDVQD